MFWWDYEIQDRTIKKIFTFFVFFCVSYVLLLLSGSRNWMWLWIFFSLRFGNNTTFKQSSKKAKKKHAISTFFSHSLGPLSLSVWFVRSCSLALTHLAWCSRFATVCNGFFFFFFCCFFVRSSVRSSFFSLLRFVSLKSVVKLNYDIRNVVHSKFVMCKYVVCVCATVFLSFALGQCYMKERQHHAYVHATYDSSFFFRSHR